MDRRKLLGSIGALALTGVLSFAAFAGTSTPAKLACDCCGKNCPCPACVCDWASTASADKAGKDCGCCGGATCCPTDRAAGPAGV
jgi:hypothetical protein